MVGVFGSVNASFVGVCYNFPIVAHFPVDHVNYVRILSVRDKFCFYSLVQRMIFVSLYIVISTIKYTI